jgi:hypothetical protein
MRLNVKDLIRGPNADGDSDEEAEAMLANSCGPVNGTCQLI